MTKLWKTGLLVALALWSSLPAFAYYAPIDYVRNRLREHMILALGDDNRSHPTVTDSKGVDEYLADLQRRIKKSWFPPRDQESCKTVVTFKVNSRGEMSDLRIQDSSGIATANQAALDAVRNAAPFRPLPQGAKAVEQFQFTFAKGQLNANQHTAESVVPPTQRAVPTTKPENTVDIPERVQTAGSVAPIPGLAQGEIAQKPPLTASQPPLRNGDVAGFVEQIIESVRNSPTDPALIEATLKRIKGSVTEPLPINAELAQELLAKSSRKFKENDVKAALSLAKSATREDPSNSESWLFLAMCEAAAKDIASSKIHCLQCLAIAPSESIPWRVLGVNYALDGDSQRATECFILSHHFSTDKLAMVHQLEGLATADVPFSRAARAAVKRIASEQAVLPDRNDLLTETNSSASTIPAGWHRLPRPGGITPIRWQEIQEYEFQTLLDQAYRPSVGDICFISMTTMGWVTPAAKDTWVKEFNNWGDAHWNDLKARPPQSLFEDTAAASNGTLIVLDAGTKVRVVEGVWNKTELAPTSDARLQILSGPLTGQTCFTMGIGLEKRPPNPNKLNEFCKTELDRQAIRAIFMSRSLSRNGDVDLNPDELRLHMLLERDE